MHILRVGLENWNSRHIYQPLIVFYKACKASHGPRVVLKHLTVPDKVTGLFEALGTEIAAVGELGLRFQLDGSVFDLADSVSLGRRLGQDALGNRGLLPGVLRQLGRLLLGEGDYF